MELLHRRSAFDLVYMHEQIADHRAVLKLLDDQLIPAAQAPELRALLVRARADEADHLTLSRAILIRLGERR